MKGHDLPSKTATENTCSSEVGRTQSTPSAPSPAAQRWNSVLFTDPVRSLAGTARACYWDRLTYAPFTDRPDIGSFLVDLTLTTCPPAPAEG